MVPSQRLQTVLDFLLAEPEAFYFNQPVDPVALNLPTYFDVVKHPMDYSTIQAKLSRGEYRDQNGALFEADVLLVFSNAML